MAEFWSNNDRGYRIRLWIDQASQNVSSNSSQVRVRLALLNTTTTFAQYSCNASVTVNGQTLNWSGSPSVLSYNQTVMLIDKTITVGHNADGTKSFSLSARFTGSGGYSPGTLTIGGNSFTLTTIQRLSTISFNGSDIGGIMTITINRHNSSYKHTLRYQWSDKTGTIATNVDTYTTWTIPSEFASDLGNATNGTGTIFVDTYSGSTKLGTQQTTFTASVAEGAKPTFSGVTLTDTNTVVRGLLSGNNFLQIISNIKVTFNGASGSYGSSIVGYRAEIVGKNQVINEDGGTLGIMNFSGSATIRASVIDSRGRQSETKDITINVIEYFAPMLSFSATRTRALPNTIQVTRDAKIAPISLYGNQKNVMSLSFKVAPLNSTNYTVDNGSATGTYTTISNLTGSSATLSGNYAADRSFVIVGTLSDKFTSIDFEDTVTTEKTVVSYDQFGAGITKIRERGALDVGGDAYFAGRVYGKDDILLGSYSSDVVVQDLNNLFLAGLHTISNITSGQPDGIRKSGIVEVMVSNMPKYNGTSSIWQTLYTSDGEIYKRHRIKSANWTDWVNYTQKQLPPEVVNTDWVVIGNGFKYKRSGDVIALQFDFSTNYTQRFSVGNIPHELIPGIALMYQATAWDTYINKGVQIQINTDGLIEWINQSRVNIKVSGQLQWMI